MVAPIDECHLLWQNGIMSTKITVDKAGRVVLPKPVRDKLRLEAGDVLQLETEGERITLRPARPQVTLKKEKGIWVFQGEPSAASIPALIDEMREERGRETLE
jgi:AbrB family looped-hinge helix DNA binding protein